MSKEGSFAVLLKGWASPLRRVLRISFWSTWVKTALRRLGRRFRRRPYRFQDDLQLITRWIAGKPLVTFRKWIISVRIDCYINRARVMRAYRDGTFSGGVRHATIASHRIPGRIRIRYCIHLRAYDGHGGRRDRIIHMYSTRPPQIAHLSRSRSRRRRMS